MPPAPAPAAVRPALERLQGAAAAAGRVGVCRPRARRPAAALGQPALGRAVAAAVVDRRRERLRRADERRLCTPTRPVAAKSPSRSAAAAPSTVGVGRRLLEEGLDCRGVLCGAGRARSGRRRQRYRRAASGGGRAARPSRPSHGLCGRAGASAVSLRGSRICTARASIVRGEQATMRARRKRRRTSRVSHDFQQRRRRSEERAADADDAPRRLLRRHRRRGASPSRQFIRTAQPSSRSAAGGADAIIRDVVTTTTISTTSSCGHVTAAARARRAT